MTNEGFATQGQTRGLDLVAWQRPRCAPASREPARECTHRLSGALGGRAVQAAMSATCNHFELIHKRRKLAYGRTGEDPMMVSQVVVCLCLPLPSRNHRRLRRQQSPNASFPYSIPPAPNCIFPTTPVHPQEYTRRLPHKIQAHKPRSCCLVLDHCSLVAAERLSLP